MKEKLAWTVKFLGVVCAMTVLFWCALIPQKALAEPPSAPAVSTGGDTTETAAQWRRFDPDVTVAGKAAARSRETLNWALAIKDSGFAPSASGEKPAIQELWTRVFQAVIAVYFIVIVVIAFGMILKLNWAERTRRALPALLIGFAAASLSFAALTLTIRTADRALTQRFYTIHKSGENADKPAEERTALNHLRAEDLLSTSFNYQDFVGFRRVGTQFDEAVRNHLLIIKAVTWTNYAIAFIIVFRILILWGLIIFSPFMFPFLAFPLTKNVAVVWVRELFRWLFLGPLFALFLTAVPYIWDKTNISHNIYGVNRESGIPLAIEPNILKGGEDGEATFGNVYQSGTNIILLPPGSKGPRAQLTDDATAGNNLSETDSYARYIIALLMIWAAIILPFLLLRITMGLTVEAGKSISNVWSKSSAAEQILKKIRPGAPSPPPAPPGGGKAAHYRQIVTRPLSESKVSQTIAPATGERFERTATLKEKTVERLSLPAVFNITGVKNIIPEAVSFLSAVPGDKEAKWERKRIAELSRIERDSEVMEKTREVFSKIASPEKISDRKELAIYRTIKQSIEKRDAAGDRIARAVKNALTNNITHYLKTDINQEFNDSRVNNFAASVQNLTQTSASESEVKNFQNIYQTSATNLHQYLSQRQDQPARLALGALRKAQAAAGQVASAENVTDQDIANAYHAARKIAYSDTAASAEEREEFRALNQFVASAAAAGDKSASRLLETGQSVIDLAASRDKTTSRQIANFAARSVVQNISNLFQSKTESKSLQNFQKTYQTSTTNYREYLARKAQSGEGQARLALGALDKARQMISAARDLKSVVTIIDKIKHPETLAGEERKEFTALKKEIGQGVKAGDTNFKDLDVNANRLLSASEAEMEDLPEEEKLPETIGQLEEAIQNDDDFQSAKELWMEHYRSAPVPLSSTIRTRADWLNKEKALLEETLSDFLSGDEARKEAALRKIEKVLPFVLMGEYKASEIAIYLLAKYEAARDVLVEITAEEKTEEEELVKVRPKKEEAKKTLAMEAEAEDNKNES